MRLEHIDRFHLAAFQERDERAGFGRNILKILLDVELIFLGDHGGEKVGAGHARKIADLFSFEFGEAFVGRIFFHEPGVAGPDLRGDQADVRAAFYQIDRRARLHGAGHGPAEFDGIGGLGEIHHHVGNLDAVFDIEPFVLDQRGDVAGLAGGAGGDINRLQGLTGLQRRSGDDWVRTARRRARALG